MTSILIVNGPNLNMLGRREPEIYGSDTLADIEVSCADHAAKLGLSVDFRQSNDEGELVTWVQNAGKDHAGIVINAGALTHYGWSLHDALACFDGPIVELHLSNPSAREAWRHESVIAPVASGTIAGFGGLGYSLAIDAIAELLAAS